MAQASVLVPLSVRLTWDTCCDRHQSTYLRPNGFMSNALLWADGIREQNSVVDATGPGRQPVVDPEDIARVATLVLTEDGHVGHGYNLNDLFRAGRAGVIADDLENLTGVAPRTFRDWCERHVDEFR